MFTNTRTSEYIASAEALERYSPTARKNYDDGKLARGVAELFFKTHLEDFAGGQSISDDDIKIQVGLASFKGNKHATNETACYDTIVLRWGTIDKKDADGKEKPEGEVTNPVNVQNWSSLTKDCPAAILNSELNIIKNKKPYFRGTLETFLSDVASDQAVGHTGREVSEILFFNDEDTFEFKIEYPKGVIDPDGSKNYFLSLRMMGARTFMA
jgi:hypothetical protein